MIKFITVILKFDKQGEKTGWTYMEIPASLAEQMLPGHKKSFRVKGKLDGHTIQQVALIPMGEANFILPLNAALRKLIGKRKGAQLEVILQLDISVYELNKELMECLADEPAALDFFKSKPLSFQNYYSKWIESAKTDGTKAKRIALAVTSLTRKIEFGEMLRNQRQQKD